MPATILLAVVTAVLTVAPDGVTPAERLTIEPGLAPRLLALAPGESTHLPAWPIEPGRRADVVLMRRDVYAPGAEIDVIDGEASSKALRSTLAFYFGAVAGDEAEQVVVSVDPRTMRLSSFARTSEGWTELRALDGEYLLAPEAGFLDPSIGPVGFTCEDESTEVAEPEAPPSPPSADIAAPTALNQMTLAVDTDNEFMSLKFGNSISSATDYVATLVALMSVVYERDLGVRLVQGTTILRPSTTADPYLQSGTGNADSAKLNEFRSIWMANYASVNRGTALLLSGKQSSASSASGIAYVNALCSTNTGYAFSQVFKFSGSTASSDTKLVAHEIGHNFGSRHTHCYLDPTPIDMCYASESGCYSGPTSCPAAQTINGVANVRGTLMSYCHNLAGCSSSSVFHPRTVDLIDPIVASKVGVCVFPASTANPKEASPSGAMTAQRSGTAVSVAYEPACGATQHTVYAGNLGTLHSGGLAWSQRYCGLGASGSLSFVPSGSVYFVVVGNSGTIEGSYGARSSGERPAAGAGGACSYTQDLSGSCP